MCEHQSLVRASGLRLRSKAGQVSPFLLGQSFSDVSTEVCPMAEEGDTQVRVGLSRDLGNELICTDNRECIRKSAKLGVMEGEALLHLTANWAMTFWDKEREEAPQPDPASEKEKMQSISNTRKKKGFS